MLDDLLNYIMNLIFQIQSLYLLIFCIGDQEFVSYLHCFLCFLLKNNQFNHFLYHFNILLLLISSYSLARSLLVPYVYISRESIDSHSFIIIWTSCNLIHFFSKNLLPFTFKDTMKAYFCYYHTLFWTTTLRRLFYLLEIYTIVLLMDVL